MAKLYATLETARGKQVSISDNDEIKAVLYCGNLKQYQVNIEWCNVGDLKNPTYDALVTVREWRNVPESKRQKAQRK